MMFDTREKMHTDLTSQPKFRRLSVLEGIQYGKVYVYGTDTVYDTDTDTYLFVMNIRKLIINDNISIPGIKEMKLLHFVQTSFSSCSSNCSARVFSSSGLMTEVANQHSVVFVRIFRKKFLLSAAVFSILLTLYFFSVFHCYLNPLLL